MNMGHIDYTLVSGMKSLFNTELKIPYGQAEQNKIMCSLDVPVFDFGGVDTTRALTWGQYVRENQIIEAEVPFYGSVSDTVNHVILFN